MHPATAITSALCVGLLTLAGCASAPKDVYRKEAFDAGTSYSAKIRHPSKVACWSVKRAFLDQGYMLDRSSAESATLTGVKDFQPSEDTNVTLRLQTSCADNNDGTSTVYATAVREVNKLQDQMQHRSVGFGIFSLTLPAGSARALQPLERETIKDAEFYRRFYALVTRFADEDARTMR